MPSILESNYGSQWIARSKMLLRLQKKPSWSGYPRLLMESFTLVDNSNLGFLGCFFFFHFAESNMCSLDYTLHLSGEVKERHCSWTTTTTKSCQTEHSKQFQFRWKGCSCSSSSDLKIVFYVSRQVFNWKCNLTTFNRGKEKCTGFSIVRPIKMKS